MPVGAESFSEALRWGVEVFHTLKGVLKKRGYNTAVGDEGGFAPSVKSNVEAIEVVLEAIQQAGYKPGEQIAIALDPAASEFFKDGKYIFKKSDNSVRSSEEMVALLGGLDEEISDCFARRRPRRRRLGRLEDSDRELGDKIQLVGDDLFVTNIETPAARNRQRHRQLDSDQSQPDRHRQRNPRRHRPRPPQRIHLDHLAPLRRKRRHLHCRPRRRDRRRADQDRFSLAHRPHCEVQPVAED